MDPNDPKGTGQPSAEGAAEAGAGSGHHTPIAAGSAAGSATGSLTAVHVGSVTGSEHTSSSLDVSADSSVANVVSNLTVAALKRMRMRSAGMDGQEQQRQQEQQQQQQQQQQEEDVSAAVAGDVGTADATAATVDGDDDDARSLSPAQSGSSGFGGGASDHTTPTGQDHPDAGVIDVGAEEDYEEEEDDDDDDDDDDDESGNDEEEADEYGADNEDTLMAHGDEGIGTGEEEDEELEEQLMVLEPDHPLMQQYQAQVAVHLSEQKDKLQAKQADKRASLKQKEKERDDIGVTLYSLQQQLAKQQQLLQEQQQLQEEVNGLRKECEFNLTQSRARHQKALENSRQHHSELEAVRSKLEKEALDVRHLEMAAASMRSSMEANKAEAKRIDKDALEAEEAKHQRDAYMDWMLRRLGASRKQVDLYQSQLRSQAFEAQQAKDAVNDAVHELEVLKMEKADLLKQWTSSLRAMKQRDEAFSALQDALRKEDELQIAANAELGGYARSITKEQERHEQLTAHRNRLRNELQMVRSQLDRCREKQSQLQMEYQAYTRSLHQTEQQLQKAQTDRTLRRQELDTVRHQSEREVGERLHLEDAILEKTMATLTLDKAAEYSRKILQKLREDERKRMATIVECQGDIERTLLDVDSTKSEREVLLDDRARLLKLLDERNTLISRSEAEILKRNVIVERKQSQIDQLNKKIDRILTDRGGDEDVGPLELTVKTLQKQIEESQAECRQQEQFWMRQEHELVRRMKEEQQQSAAIEQKRKSRTIMEQKKIRQEADIEREEKTVAALSNEIRQMQVDMVRLNSIIADKRGREQHLIQDTVLLENDFVGELKDAEHEAVGTRMEISASDEAKERLKNSVVEAEQQIMLWERKIQIAKETKATLNSDAMAGEIRNLKTDVHVFQNRLDEVKRRQQELIRLMESTVKQRSSISFKADVQATAGKPNKTRGHHKKQVAELTRKVRQTQENSSACEKEIVALRNAQEDFFDQIKAKQESCGGLSTMLSSLQEKTEAESRAKDMLAFEARWQQTRQKHWAAVAAGRYTPVVKKREDGPTTDEELTRYKTQMQALLTLGAELGERFPQQAALIQRKILDPMRAAMQTVS